MSSDAVTRSSEPINPIRAQAKEPLVKPRRGNDGLFWWTIGIIFLTGITIFSWVFCLYVFTYPDKPFNYQLLTRLNKLPPLESFEIVKVPGGPQLTAQEIYTEFNQLQPKLRTVKNGDLLRAYIWNYSEDDAPVYLTGKFEAIESRPLTANDVFTTGVVVRGRSKDYPNVYLDLILPTKPEDVPEVQFRAGDVITLEKRRLFASVLNLYQPTEDDLLISAISLIYGRYRIDDRRFINQSPPELLNVEGALPNTGLPMPGATRSRIPAPEPVSEEE